MILHYNILHYNKNIHNYIYSLRCRYRYSYTRIHINTYPSTLVSDFIRLKFRFWVSLGPLEPEEVPAVQNITASLSPNAESLCRLTWV